MDLRKNEQAHDHEIEYRPRQQESGKEVAMSQSERHFSDVPSDADTYCSVLTQYILHVFMKLNTD
jgi:hypothetical protein